MLIKQQSFLLQTIIKIKIMGNLQLNSSNHSSYSRKPIFRNQSPISKQTACKSVSPYLSRRPYENSHRSVVNRFNAKLNSSTISVRSGYSNRIYMNPKMIRSVIKNSSPQQIIVRPSTTRLYKPKQNTDQQTYLNLNKTSSKSFKRYQPISKQKHRYLQKQFEISPRKVNKIDYTPSNQKLFLQLDLEQKQNIQALAQQKDKVPTLTPINNYTISLSKTPLLPAKNSQKIGNSNTVKNSQSQSPNHYFHKNECCCHHNHNNCLLNTPNQQERELNQNLPTERKNHINMFSAYQDTMYEDFCKRRVKKQSSDLSPYPAPYPYPTRIFQEQLERQKYKNTKNDLINSSIIHQKNREKCQQIIKRVRNFNQFLNQVKNKLRKQVQMANSQNNTIDYLSFSQHQHHSLNNPSQYENNTSVDHNSRPDVQASRSKSITLALRLQNQKIELEKYRKLVQRQLSKQHSIQSIEIDSKNKDKIITINFQKKISNKQLQTKKQRPNDQNITSDIKQNQVQNEQEAPPLKVINKKQKDSTTNTGSKYSQSYTPSSYSNQHSISLPQSHLQSKAYSQFQASDQKPHDRDRDKGKGKEIKQKKLNNMKDITARVDNIKKLFSKMEGMSKIQTNAQEKLWEILKDQANLEDDV